MLPFLWSQTEQKTFSIWSNSTEIPNKINQENKTEDKWILTNGKRQRPLNSLPHVVLAWWNNQRNFWYMTHSTQRSLIASWKSFSGCHPTRVANLVTRLPDLVTFADIPVTNFFEFFSYHMSLSLSLIVFSVAFLTILYERERERHEIEWRERQRETSAPWYLRRSHSFAHSWAERREASERVSGAARSGAERSGANERGSR